MQMFPYPTVTPEPNPTIPSSTREHLLQPLSPIPSTDLLPNGFPSLTCCFVSDPKPGRHSMGHHQATLVREASSLTADLNLSLCSSKSNSWVSYLALRQNICCYTNPHLQWITQILHSKLPLSHRRFVSDPKFADTPLVPSGHSDQRSKLTNCRSSPLPAFFRILSPSPFPISVLHRPSDGALLILCPISRGLTK